MRATQLEKATRFRALHEAPGVFVIPNPWDIGSARILAGLGFQALATSSAACACALGRKDGELTREIRRLQALEKAGADVLFAPGLPDLASVRAVCSALSKPFNFMVGIKDKSFSVSELAAVGVKRISLATSLYRAAMTAFLAAATEVREKGQFTFLDNSVTTIDLLKRMPL